MYAKNRRVRYTSRQKQDNPKKKKHLGPTEYQVSAVPYTRFGLCTQKQLAIHVGITAVPAFRCIPLGTVPPVATSFTPRGTFSPSVSTSRSASEGFPPTVKNVVEPSASDEFPPTVHNGALCARCSEATQKGFLVTVPGPQQPDLSVMHDERWID